MQDGSTPLHMATKNGHTAIVEALLAAGADLNIQGEVCTSPHPAPTSRVVSPRVVVCCDGASHHDGGPRVSLTAR
jgi:ankyrin repeat protein